jgi:hypothetical protein
MKCIIILSSKSSGSSVLQKILAKSPNINVVNKTCHYQNETLYWTKAASILNLPQQVMTDSGVPYSSERSYRELVTLLKDNLGDYDPPSDLRQLVFDGWARLCERHAPIFLEKSPHHLHQESALNLILECIEALENKVDFLLIGLVRNPMDTLYSAFRRWRTPPEKMQYEWLTAYTNLVKLKDVISDKLVIIRYEDIIRSPSHMQPIFDFCNIQHEKTAASLLHQNSVHGWRKDKLYGFNLADEVIYLAKTYGYAEAELLNQRTFLWPIYRDLSRYSHFVIKPIKMRIVDSKIRSV